MPQRAFVPVPLVEAQPRVYKSFRPRQLQGICAGLAGAGISLVSVGIQDFSGYILTFLAALPGLAYGYYQPHGKPVEYWLRVWVRYYAAPRIWSARPAGLRAAVLEAEACGRTVLRVCWHLILRRVARWRER